jgi:hypothetical protein
MECIRNDIGRPYTARRIRSRDPHARVVTLASVLPKEMPMATQRSRDDDDRDEDRTAERMQAKQEASRQAEDPAEQALPTPEEGSREHQGMGTARQRDGGGSGNGTRPEQA